MLLQPVLRIVDDCAHPHQSRPPPSKRTDGFLAGVPREVLAEFGEVVCYRFGFLETDPAPLTVDQHWRAFTQSAPSGKLSSGFAEMDSRVAAMINSRQQHLRVQFVELRQGGIFSEFRLQGVFADDSFRKRSTGSERHLWVRATQHARVGPKALGDCAHVARRRQCGVVGRHFLSNGVPPRLRRWRCLPVCRIRQLPAVRGHHERATLAKGVKERRNHGLCTTYYRAKPPHGCVDDHRRTLDEAERTQVRGQAGPRDWFTAPIVQQLLQSGHFFYARHDTNIGPIQADLARRRPSSRASAVKFASTASQSGWLFGQSLTGRTPIRPM